MTSRPSSVPGELTALHRRLLTVEKRLPYSTGGNGGGTTILTGFGPPTPDIGNTGDFYVDTAGDVLYGPKQELGQYGPAEYFLTDSPQYPSYPVAQEIGYRFNTTVPGRVTAVRLLRPPPGGAATTVTVTLWSAAGAILGTGTAAVGTPSQFQVIPLVSPVSIVASTMYIASATYVDGYPRTDTPPVPPHTGPHVTLITARYGATAVFPINEYPMTTFVEPVFQPEVADVWPVAMDPAGGGGDQVLGYAFTQSTPASVWTVNHSLTFWPNVAVVDSAGSQVEGTVAYVDGDTLTISFSAAFAGTAYLS